MARVQQKRFWVKIRAALGIGRSRALWQNPQIHLGVPMSKVCQVSGKRPISGNNVSHANNKTRRRFLPNLHYRKLWVEGEKRWVRLRLSHHALRTIDKKGLDVVLAEMRARGESI